MVTVGSASLRCACRRETRFFAFSASHCAATSEFSRAGGARGQVTLRVSHRFSTVRSADLILVIEDGRVAEPGSHDELILRDGLYSELYFLQARSYA